MCMHEYVHYMCVHVSMHELCTYMCVCAASSIHMSGGCFAVVKTADQFQESNLFPVPCMHLHIRTCTYM